ncbi:hypothetical protein FGG79_05655 [Bacillus sp. BHET2]|uniref:hypothetical protein n=1 Tax=Bacillus sp. BHET2 TaxID=2583818 RepID=UPI00110F49DB|nr:hypothetical protein [Bacillus sp. BHET2]TMU87605.1 hypothetical protein FGG79_05655 [Bacillus sp. BHET2]
MNIRLTFLFLLTVILTFSIVTILNNPTEEEYVDWLQEEYNVDCNIDCSIIESEKIEGNITKRIKVAVAPPSYSTGLFTLSISGQYKNLDDPEHIEKMNVLGFNGRFYVMNSGDVLE